MRTDLENEILELNETLLAQKVVSTKIALEIQKQVHGIENQVDPQEASVRAEGEKLMLELKTYSPSGFGRYRQMFESNMTLEEWFEQQRWLRGQSSKLIEKLMKRVCIEPLPLQTAFQMAQQWGAHYLDNMFEVVDAMATIVRQAPRNTRYYIHSGPMGQIYVLIPKPGWNFSSSEPHAWQFTPDATDPITYELPK